MQRDFDMAQCEGRWFDILVSLGLPQKALRNQHGPCPMCGGKDRFRWDNKNGRGTYYCSGCGAGTGPDLAMKFLHIDYRQLVREIEPIIGKTKVRKAAKPLPEQERRRLLNELWDVGERVSKSGPVATYLRGRLGVVIPSRELRAVLQGDGNAIMVARVRDPSGLPVSLHRTFIDCDGVKRDRKLMPGEIPPGSAVRLMQPCEKLGIAEGIETAFAASILFQIPCWASLNTSLLKTWEPPADVKQVVVFGDNDRKLAGQAAAFEQARKCAVLNKEVEVRIPDTPGDDWNDVFLATMNSTANKGSLPWHQ
jgi:putative DNA primase/helicase